MGIAINQILTLSARRRAYGGLLHWLLIPGIAIGMILWPTFSSGLESLQYDPGDTLLNLYFLEHAYQHLSKLNLAATEQFWSPEFFWPIKGVLAWSDHMLGPSLIYGLFRSLLNPYQSYLGWLSSTLFLNYFSVRSSSQYISPTTPRIWISAATLVATFSPAITQQLSHPQLLSLFLIGPIIWLCHRLVCLAPDDFSWSDWALLMIFLLSNGFFNIYIFVYASYGSLICVCIHIIRRLKHHNWQLRRGNYLTIRCILLAGCLLANTLVYVPYLQTIRTFGKRPVDEIIVNLPKPASWFYSSDYWLLPAPLTPINIKPGWINGAEQECFPGWGLCIFMVAALLTALWLKRNNNGNTRTWLLALAIMLLGTLSVHNVSFWPLISKLLPGASSLRASSRVCMMIVLFATPSIVLAAKDWNWFQQHHLLRPLVGLLAYLSCFAGIWGINLPSFSLSAWRKEMEAISNALETSDCDVFWYEWHDQQPWRGHVIAMHMQLRTGISTANGYSGHFPRENWPFTSASGDSAYDWIRSNSTSSDHVLKPLSHKSAWCIASIDNNQRARIRKYSPLNANKHLTARRTITKPNSIVFQGEMIAIGKKYGQLYLKYKHGPAPSEWILLNRDGSPIPANRGEYVIVGTRIDPSAKEPIVFITDQNKKARVQYEWMINGKTGRFIGQTVKNLPSR